ncbi:MAG: hypothetical protein DME84_01715 [Verrucomicrobia bacterium]|nr:MAG: hypothetical protein DME84_01715 [Verrucomicrobiota bacterium]
MPGKRLVGWFESLARAHPATFQPDCPEILIRLKYLFPVAGIAICLLEISYPVFIWNRRTRGIWLMCICAMHLAIGLTMGMYLFASIMIVLNVAAFGPGLRLARNETLARAALS